jgi:hypothetical protein
VTKSARRCELRPKQYTAIDGVANAPTVSGSGQKLETASNCTRHKQSMADQDTSQSQSSDSGKHHQVEDLVSLVPNLSRYAAEKTEQGNEQLATKCACGTVRCKRSEVTLFATIGDDTHSVHRRVCDPPQSPRVCINDDVGAL